ncbi:hypothetical protein Trydic_g13621 [Trypoxylus dichotomus]
MREENMRQWCIWKFKEHFSNVHANINCRRANIQEGRDRMKEHYDVRSEEDGYQLGDLVRIYNPQRRRGFSSKLQRSCEGLTKLSRELMTNLL